MEHKPLHGLVLVGGKSERMGRDKALLSYDGKHTQLDRVASLLNEVCDRVFVSQREDQGFTKPEQTEVIYDAVETVHGPLRGILSAMQHSPEADWLVVACDLPRLQRSTLEKIITEFHTREPEITAYKSSYDSLPEPLCAIYPSGADAELLQLSTELGKSCPRKLLIIKKAKLIQQDDPRSLDNVNTAEEFASAHQ